MKHVSLYLRRLKFPPALLNSVAAKYFTNLRLIILIVLGISIFGAFSFLGLPRNLFPDVTIPEVIVTTVFPGAGPNDVESLVTIPIEDAVTGLSGVKNVTSSSLESVSSVVVEFNTGVNIDKGQTDIGSAINSVALPSSSQKPNVIKLDIQKTPIWTFAITSDRDFASLLRFSQRLKQDLTDLPSIESVSIQGVVEREIQVIIRPASVSDFNINPQQLLGAVKSAINSYPSGSVKTENSTFALTINSSITSIDDIRQLKVNLGGQIVNIQDIADVVEITKPNQLPIFVGEKNGKIKQAINFTVYRVSTVNVEKAQSQAQDLAVSKLKGEHNDFSLLSEINSSKLITDQFSELQKDLIETIILVALVLFLFLGARSAAVALLATPLTFLISFSVMSLTGITLNFLSVFALLLSLGLLVDDTIVVVSAISAYNRAAKFTPLQTGLLVFRDFIAAITTTTATTVWAFLPILIAGGLIGLFIKPIPIVVSTTLAGSFFVAIFITLPFMIFLLKPALPRRLIIFIRIILIVAFIGFLYAVLPKNGLILFQIVAFVVVLFVTFLIRKEILVLAKSRFDFQRFSKRINLKQYLDSGVLSFQRIEFNYNRAIINILNSKTLRRRIIIMVIIFSVFSYLLVPLGFVKNEFFPKTNGDTLSATLELPAGTNLNASKIQAQRILKTLLKTPQTDYVILSLGGGGGFGPFAGGASTENISSFTLVLKEKNQRKQNSSQIADYLREEFKNYNRGVFSVNEETGGPPAGADIEFKIFGTDLSVLDKYADKAAVFLKKEPGATNVQKSIKTSIGKIVFVPDGQKLASHNLTQDAVGFWLRLFATGLKIDSIRLDKDSNTSEDITLRMGSSIPNAQDISALNIPTTLGAVIPITSLGTLVLQPNPTLITRENGKRTISVTAGVKSGYTIPQVNSKIEKYANQGLNLPPGYTWQTGGVNQQNQESVGDIYKAMLISVLLIVITMVLQFGSFRRAIIVILVIPLAVSGVFIIFGLTQTALTFPALVGVLALFGIVVKNSILIMDRIVANIKTGMEFTQSIADAASSRLEPIALTSICAIVGLIPITISDPLWRGLGGAIIAGLTFSGTIMLFFIPVVYFMVFNPKKAKK